LQKSGMQTESSALAWHHYSFYHFTTSNSWSYKILKQKNLDIHLNRLFIFYYYCPNSNQHSLPSEGANVKNIKVEQILSFYYVTDTLLGMCTGQGTRPGSKFCMYNYCYYSLGKVFNLFRLLIPQQKLGILLLLKLYLDQLI
jgi:hypothetical protein